MGGRKGLGLPRRKWKWKLRREMQKNRMKVTGGRKDGKGSIVKENTQTMNDGERGRRHGKPRQAAFIDARRDTIILDV